MQNISLTVALLAGALTLASCGPTGGSSLIGALSQGQTATAGSSTTSTTDNGTTSLLGNLLGSVLGESATLSAKSVVGTWKYCGTDCVFESESLLAKAGGAVAATEIEEKLNAQLAKVGIKSGSCSYTFNSDNTYTAIIGGREISGNYTLDTKQKTMKLTYLGGLASYTTRVALSGGKLSLLIEGDKLLTLVKGVSALSNNSNLNTLSSLLSNYDGLYVGIQMSK